MPFWLVFILGAIFMAIRSCAPDNSVTLNITQDEFINAYNEEVPADMKLIMLDENHYVKVDQFDKYKGSERFTFGCTIEKDNKLSEINANYMYELEPDKKPSKEGLEKMEQMFIASIDAVDNGWFTDEKGILNELGLYGKSAPAMRGYEKDNIYYDLRVSDVGYNLYIRAKKY